MGVDILARAMASGKGGGSSTLGIKVDHDTDEISLTKSGEPIPDSGAVLPKYGLDYDTATGGLTLTKDGQGIHGETVDLPPYGSPLKADAIADMTDTDKVYVLTTDGHWYYYDGSAWTDGGVYNAVSVVTDKTLTVADVPADAKATGDELYDLKTQINDDLEIILNYDAPQNITGWVQGWIRDNGSFGNASTTCRTSYILFNTDAIITLNVKTGYKFDLFEYSSNAGANPEKIFGKRTESYEFTNKNSHYYALAVWKTDESTLNIGDLPEDVVTVTYGNTTDKTLTKSGKSADAKITGDAIEQVKRVINVSPNLLNPEDVTEHAYISPAGLQTSSDYASWFATGYIDVNGESLLQASIDLKSIIIYMADGTVDSANSYSGLNTSATLPYHLPATAKKIRISAYMTDLTDAMINYGETALPYQPYGTKIKQDALELKDNAVLPKLNSNVTAENYMSACKQALKKNVLLSYYATFTEFNSLKIGFTTTDNYSTGYLDYLEITSDNFILHRKNQNDLTWPHGMTLKDYISVHITFDFSMNFTAVLKTNGGDFTKSNYFYLGASYYPFAIIDATGAANKSLSFSCSDFQKSVLLFGDSYFSNSSARWLYYLTDEQRKNLCINGYAGESSPSAIIDCESLFGLCTPKFAVWCLGMNDGSDADDTIPSTQWLTNIQKFIQFCNDKNIQPILATIPSVPTINNRAKSAWVRESGYRFIDFAYAVNNGNDGSWYDNMLSGDGVHPDVAGAKALYDRAITDFPELLID